MKPIIAAAGLAALLATSAIAQDRPAGWQSMPCNPDQFSAVMLSNGEVAYWTNPSCPSSAGGGTGPVAPLVQVIVQPPPPPRPERPLDEQ